MHGSNYIYIKNYNRLFVAVTPCQKEVIALCKFPSA